MLYCTCSSVSTLNIHAVREPLLPVCEQHRWLIVRGLDRLYFFLDFGGSDVMTRAGVECSCEGDAASLLFKSVDSLIDVASDSNGDFT